MALRHTDGVDPPRDAVARKIIHLAQAGERDRLCEGVFRELQPITVPVLPCLPLRRSQAGERPDETRTAPFGLLREGET